MKLLSRLYPLFLGVVAFNFIRLTTDLAKNEVLWSNSMKYHLHALGLLIVMSYLFDFIYRLFLVRVQPKLKGPAALEYLYVILQLFVATNLIIFIGDRTSFLMLGNALVDYIIADVICIPLFFLYYLLLRSGKMEGTLHKQSLQLEKVKVDQLEMELKFLRSQYHPHFLFNALNTVYFQIDEQNKQPRRTLEMLSELLRYQLYSDNKQVSVQKEIDYLQTYMEMQKLRMSERLQLIVFFSPGLGKLSVYPLLFLPLVENAFKYVGGEYRIDCRMYEADGNILFEITNTIPSLPPAGPKKKGIGLENLRRRLVLLYPDKHSLVAEKRDNAFIAKLIIKTE